MTEDWHLLAGLLARPDEAAFLRLLAPGFQTFATGSRVYGAPRANSDYDFVVYASEQQAAALAALAPDAGVSGDGSLRAGPVNLIVFTNASRYCAWRDATLDLAARAPVGRHTAVAEIDRQLALRGLT